MGTRNNRLIYEGFVQFKEYTTLGEFAKWFGVTVNHQADISWLKAEHVEAFEKTEDIYAEYESRDYTTSFPKFNYKQDDAVSMRYDDAPLFHLDTEWLLELDRSARNKKEIVSLRRTLGETTTELAELKAMFQKFMAASQVSAVVRPSAPELGEEKREDDIARTASTRSSLSINSQSEGVSTTRPKLPESYSHAQPNPPKPATGGLRHSPELMRDTPSVN